MVLSVVAVPLIDPALPGQATNAITAYVTSVGSGNEFSVSYQPVRSDSTTFFDNLSPGEIDANDLLLIRGTLQADRSILADFIRHLPAN